jgi:hypothetical protein
LLKCLKTAFAVERHNFGIAVVVVAAGRRAAGEPERGMAVVLPERDMAAVLPDMVVVLPRGPGNMAAFAAVVVVPPLDQDTIAGYRRQRQLVLGLVDHSWGDWGKTHCHQMYCRNREDRLPRPRSDWRTEPDSHFCARWHLHSVGTYPLLIKKKKKKKEGEKLKQVDR